MKEKYGFDFYDDIIDHSYDNISSNKDRFYEFVKEIRRLHKNKQQIIDFFNNNETRFKKNQEIVKNIPYIKDDFKLISKLCKN